MQFFKSFLFALFLLVSCLTYGQAFSPADGETLNYTQVLFRWPANSTDRSYLLEIREMAKGGEFYSLQKDGHKKGAISIFKTSMNEFILDDLAFGQQYDWRVATLPGLQKSPWHSFSTGNSPLVDPEKIRVRLTHPDQPVYLPSRSAITLDYAEIMVNEQGKPIWYIPNPPRAIRGGAQLRDLKLTDEGTLTFVYQREGAYETDLKGQIIWEGPNDGQVSDKGNEEYHHYIQKLSNGHIAVLGQEYENMKLTGNQDSAEVQFGTVIEYDREGKVVWSWSSRDYFTMPDLCFGDFQKLGCTGMTHMNACFFDEENEQVYVGFRDISRIVRIDKKTGRVVDSWGDRMASGQALHGQGLIKRQHGSELLPDGNLLVFNNDSVMDPAIISSVRIFSQGIPGKAEPKLVWEFRMDFDSLTNGKSIRTGNAMLLYDGNYFVNGGGINRLLVISPKKEVLWDAFFEKTDANGKWIPYLTYRSFYAPNLHGMALSSRIFAQTPKKQAKPGFEKLELVLVNQTGWPLHVNLRAENCQVKNLPGKVLLKPFEEKVLAFKAKFGADGKLKENFAIYSFSDEFPSKISGASLIKGQ
ncbi:MAG: aryl-sulfate sulfotransferase [Bacteroidia bacterium]|nr:aryl-sulfate sulfotransferase [Bacteroidia bacterium]